MAHQNRRRDRALREPQNLWNHRVGRTARSRRCLLTLLSVSALAAAFGTAADSGPREVRQLLAEAVQASSMGDFETAWTSHRGAWEIAAESRDAGDAMLAYCERRDCPSIRTTGWLLGKPDSDLAFLTETCRGRDSNACQRWFNGLHRLRAHLGPHWRAPRQRPQKVPMRFHHVEAGHLAPWTVASVAGKPVWAILDTGAPHTVFGRDLANLWGLEYTVVGDPYTQRLWDGAASPRSMVVLHDLELGAATEERAAAVAVDDGRTNFLALGMDVLLRHGTACFEWSNGTLRLGRIGRCADGIQPFDARLEPGSTHPTILVPAPDGTTTPILVDTGSRDNHCKRSLAERLKARPLAFGDHPTLLAPCDPPDGKWPPVHEDDYHAMTIGMETLSKFEAFGWELDPFRMYFVPREGPVIMGSNSATQPERRREFLEERLASAIRAVGDGDFPVAWANLRLASWMALSWREAADARNAFCARQPCPDIWRIAWLAGRSASDLAFLGGICKDIETETCRRWLAGQHRGRTYLDPARRPLRNPASEVPLRFDGASGGSRLRTVIEVAGKTTPALLNTGARHSGFRRLWANREAVDYDVVGDPYTETRPDGTERRAREVVLHDLALGGVAEPRVLAVARDDRDAQFELGIDVLLRHGAACFALADRRLHLGTPGPCVDGRTTLGARLNPAGLPTILVAGPDGAPVTVLLDTGTRKSLCTSALAERLQGIPLRLGGHASVEASCDPDGDRLPDDGDAHDMVLGMDWLSRFEAFGWELAPFRLYFVPASAAS